MIEGRYETIQLGAETYSLAQVSISTMEATNLANGLQEVRSFMAAYHQIATAIKHLAST